ncbi:ras-like without caax 1 [Anaeramoeba flamelloides]|uniref:Ras-like without caax n=1 Tax=Anaeramoeba flamelloides TaxID=1746091 RepID=A0AAV7ZYP5_9EUKA|nr:ras-like without caax [Anaeramoeba flamelloides]KAJ6237722.1 ras-like without caax 1 [Anaeramoeba flamelloides]
MSQCKIVILGCGGVGKSALTIEFVHKRFVTTYDPTIEDAYRKQIEVDKKPYVLEIFDTAGQEEFTSISDCTIRCGDGFVIVYSKADRDSFTSVKSHFDRIHRIKDTNTKIPIILVENKADLNLKSAVDPNEGEQLSKELGCSFLKTSAKLEYNVEKTFVSLVKEISSLRSVQSEKESKKRKKKKKFFSKKNPLNRMKNRNKCFGCNLM